jgi:3-deoxy-manno-octulosonate cytidylyltransferase (CMP-KDO synthetase)
MKVIVGIPARMAASRFPGKPMAKICGMPMIEHVYKRCQLAKNVDEIFVATCDKVIFDHVISFGGKAVMTPPSIPRPGLRVAEACKKMKYKDNDIIVVVQGDEPLVHPGMVELAVKPLLKDKKIQLGTLVAPANEEEWLDTNEVKVVRDLKKDIIFMSRSPIPSKTREEIGPRLKQVAIMPFRKKFLIDFQKMSMTPCEIAESVELLRAVEHGVKVKAIDSPYRSVSVDTEKDRQEAEKVMKSDPYFKKYKTS